MEFLNLSEKRNNKKSESQSSASSFAVIFNRDNSPSFAQHYLVMLNIYIYIYIYIYI